MTHVALQRTQILLEPGQHRRLKELAHQRRTTLSELVRKMVERGLEEEAGPPPGLLDMVGTVEDGAWDPEGLDDDLHGA